MNTNTMLFITNNVVIHPKKCCRSQKYKISILVVFYQQWEKSVACRQLSLLQHIKEQNSFSFLNYCKCKSTHRTTSTTRLRGVFAIFTNNNSINNNNNLRIKAFQGNNNNNLTVWSAYDYFSHRQRKTRLLFREERWY